MSGSSGQICVIVNPLVGGILFAGSKGGGGISRTAGTYVAPGKHLEHCLRRAGLCLEPLQRSAKHSSPPISEHRDCWGALGERCNNRHMQMIQPSTSHYFTELIKRS